MKSMALEKFSSWFKAKPIKNTTVKTEKQGLFDRYADYKLKKNQQKIDADLKMKQLDAESKSNMKLYTGIAAGAAGGYGAKRGYDNYKQGKPIVS